MRNCKQCGAPFERNHKKQIYCSDRCRRLAWAERQKELEKGTPDEQSENDHPEAIASPAGVLSHSACP
jgi:endogenous inhibitor of DNA gyrase (YacG/DUF329 family)